MKIRNCLFVSFYEPQYAAKNRKNLIEKGFIDIGFSVDSAHVYGKDRNKLKSIYLMLILFFKICFLNREDIIYIYGPFYFSLYISIAKFKGIRVVCERTEYPSIILFPNKIKKVDKVLFYLFKRVLNKVDIFVTCSRALKRYYCRFTNSDCVFVIIPFIVDIKLFPLSHLSKPIITYCGYMGGDKDGISTLIDVMHISDMKKYPFQLLLIGDGPKKDLDKYRDKVSKYNLEDKIIMKGRLSHVDTINILKESSLHILTRPNNKQAEGGFPSKLGEYLATGKPTLVTKVGDIPLYIKDGINGYIVDFSRDELVKKLNFLLSNLNSEKVKFTGLEGRKLAINHSPIKVVSKLLEVLD